MWECESMRIAKVWNWENEKVRECDGQPLSHFPIFALSHFLILILPQSHIALIRIRPLCLYVPLVPLCAHFAAKT